MVEIIINKGDSIETAIKIIGAKNSFDGVSMEYLYMNKVFRKRGKDWKLKLQALLEVNGKYYDRLDIILANGKEKSIFFDITDFFWKILITNLL